MLRRAAEKLWSNAYLLLTLTSLAWAGNQIVGKAVVGRIPPVTLACLRWVLAALIILPFAWPHLRREWPTIRAHMGLLIFLGVTGNGILNTMQYLGLQSTTALNALILNSAIPVLIPILGAIFFRDRMTVVAMIGIGVSLAGVLAVISNGSLSALLGLTLAFGDLLIFLGMLSWAVFACFMRLRPLLHMLSFVGVLYTVAALANVPFALFELAHVDALPRFTPAVAAAVGYVALFPSVLAGIAFNRGVDLIGATRSGVFSHLIPLFGAVMALVFLGERLGVHHIVGFAAILLGVWLAARK
jgi:drug/metabolite transporter (DMT)-like permease